MPDSLELHDPDSMEQKRGRAGRLEMTFQPDAEGRTYLADQYSSYPFHICRAQYMDKALPEMATMYMQSCAGGVFTGDRLQTRIHTKENAKAHVTTQASTIVHRMEEGFAHQQVDIVADIGTLTEYLPDATILFPKAKLQSIIGIKRHPSSDVIVADSFLTHDPDEKDEAFSWYESELIIQQPDGKVDAIDRFKVTDATILSGEAIHLGHYRVHGTFFVITNKIDDFVAEKALRSCISAFTGVYAGVSQLPNDTGYWVRYLAADGMVAKALAMALWSVSRELLTGFSPSLRRK